MCDCRKDLEARLLEDFRQRNPDATEHSATLNGYAFIFGSSVQMKGCMEVEYSARHAVKKGDGYKTKRTKSSMIFTFCPFCGERYEPAKATPATEAT